MKDALNLMARKEAILLDPVYSGKAFDGLIDLVKKGTLKIQIKFYLFTLVDQQPFQPMNGHFSINNT